MRSRNEEVNALAETGVRAAVIWNVRRDTCKTHTPLPLRHEVLLSDREESSSNPSGGGKRREHSKRRHRRVPLHLVLSAA